MKIKLTEEIWKESKGREIDFVHFITPTGRPFGVEVKYQSRVSGWDEQSISKSIGQGVLVTRGSFKLNKVCHIPLRAFLLLESGSYSPRNTKKTSYL